MLLNTAAGIVRASFRSATYTSAVVSVSALNRTTELTTTLPASMLDMLTCSAGTWAATARFCTNTKRRASVKSSTMASPSVALIFTNRRWPPKLYTGSLTSLQSRVRSVESGSEIALRLGIMDAASQEARRAAQAGVHMGPATLSSTSRPSSPNELSDQAAPEITLLRIKLTVVRGSSVSLSSVASSTSAVTSARATKSSTEPPRQTLMVVSKQSVSIFSHDSTMSAGRMFSMLLGIMLPCSSPSAGSTPPNIEDARQICIF
mmetsp:Transcript_28791/g.51500  ORF Transcript_28791/g.51500 Transcript_28791/m.51500 type:complete len:262 (+) Transcript_28791:307-1092(+)